MQVRLSSVGHRFGDGAWLFRGLDLTLEPERVYALSGPSGSGKSTLLSLLAGWEAPAEGEIARRGEGRVSWVFQNPTGVAGRTAADHVALPLLAAGLAPGDADRRARELLARFGLDAAAERPFRALSGGEAQRLMLARGIAAGPSLLLLDEPTAQLDRRTAADVNLGIASLRDAGTVVVVATHDPATRDSCTDRIDLREHQDEPVDARPPDDAGAPC